MIFLARLNVSMPQSRRQSYDALFLANVVTNEIYCSSIHCTASLLVRVATGIIKRPLGVFYAVLRTKSSASAGCVTAADAVCWKHRYFQAPWRFAKEHN